MHAKCALERIIRMKSKHPSSAKMSTYEADNYAHTSFLTRPSMETLEPIAYRSTEHGMA